MHLRYAHHAHEHNRKPKQMIKYDHKTYNEFMDFVVECEENEGYIGQFENDDTPRRAWAVLINGIHVDSGHPVILTEMEADAARKLWRNLQLEDYAKYCEDY